MLRRTVTGRVVSGVLRGGPLIEKFYFRVVGLLGFEPFKGTLDVRCAYAVDIRPYAAKRIDHVLMNGTLHVDAYLAPVTLSFTPPPTAPQREELPSGSGLRERIDRLKADQNNIIEQSKAMTAPPAEKTTYECWAFQPFERIDPTIIELIAKDNLRDLLGVRDGMLVDIAFSAEQAEE